MENLNNQPRKIIHVDMDAFFASVEQLDNPYLKGKPIAVGGSKERGVVAAASYEARKFGVFSAMPSITAARKCPDLIFVKPRFDRYKEVSNSIMEIFRSYTDLVEPLSLDEAYLDVTENHKGIESAAEIATEIRTKIKDELGLTASAGVSFNKFLAKTASDMNKPDGLTIVTAEEAKGIIDALPIDKFNGIGKVTAEKMKQHRIHTGADLRELTELQLSQRFGKAGLHYYKIVRGESSAKVKANRIRKSVGVERTFEQDSENQMELMKALNDLCERAYERMEKVGLKGKTITVKIKQHDFEIHTRSKTIGHFISHLSELKNLAEELFLNPVPTESLRLIGVSLSNLNVDYHQSLYQQLELEFESE